MKISKREKEGHGTGEEVKGRPSTTKRALFKFKDWRIRRADPSNLVIEQYREKAGGDNKGKMGWCFVGYHSKIEGAAMVLANEIGMRSDSLDEYIYEIRELRKMLGQTLGKARR